LLSEEDQATATGNMYRKFGEMWTYGFSRCESGQTNRQTDTQYRQADHNTSHIGEVMNKRMEDTLYQLSL